jgi:predicted neutral ceramidase superfamily lipid hydrolase
MRTVKLDPLTKVLENIAWIFWTILWVSLATGVGQNEEVFISGGVLEYYEIVTIIVVTLMWLAVLAQTVRQLFYSETGTILVRLGRWLLLGASSIFAFRTTWMLVVYGTAMHISPATLLGGGLLAIGLIVTAFGRMSEIITFDTDIEELNRNMTGTKYGI